MRLTAFSDYTLRVLMYLGLNRDRLSTIAEVARERIGSAPTRLTFFTSCRARRAGRPRCP